MLINDKFITIMEKYHDKIGPAETERIYTFVRNLNPIVPENSEFNILDAGCGRGLLSFIVLLSNKKSKAALVDVGERYRELLPLFFTEDIIRKRLNYISGDILTFDKNITDREKYDLVVCVDVLEHNVFYMDIVRKLWNDNVKQGGYLYIQTPSAYSSPNFPLISIYKKNLKQRINRILPGLVNFDGSSHVMHGLSCKELFDKTKELEAECIFSKEEYSVNPYFPPCQFKPRTSILLKKI